MTKSCLLILSLLSLLMMGQAPDVIRSIGLTHRTGFLNDALSTDLMHVSLTIKTGNTDNPSETWLERVRDKLGSMLTILGVQATPENLELYGAMAATIETSINSSIDFKKNISNKLGPDIAILSTLVCGGEIYDNLTLINIVPVQGLKDIAPSSKGHISVK